MALWRRFWRWKYPAFVGAYLRDVVWGSAYAAINDGFALVAIAFWLDPSLHLPTPSIPWATPKFWVATAVILANLRGYWRVWHRSLSGGLADAVEIEPISDFITDPLTQNREGNLIGLRCTGRAYAEVKDCQIRVESLCIKSDDGSACSPRPWFLPTDLEWEDGGTTHTFQLGARRMAELARLDGSVASIRQGGQRAILDFPGTYLAVLCVEASDYGVYRLVAEFTSPAVAWVSLTPSQPSTPRTAKAPRQ